MFKFARNTAIAALVAITALPMTASFASAGQRAAYGSIELAQGGWDRGRPHRGCSPRMAENIARDYGLRRAQVTNITPRRVVVEGRKRGGWDRMVFANVRGCPLLRR